MLFQGNNTSTIQARSRWYEREDVLPTSTMNMQHLSWKASLKSSLDFPMVLKYVSEVIPLFLQYRARADHIQLFIC